MLNIVMFMGQIYSVDCENPLIRYIKISDDFQNMNGKFNDNLIPVINWNKTNKGELFSFQDGAWVIVKGRLEIFNNRFVVVCENLTYLYKS